MRGKTTGLLSFDNRWLFACGLILSVLPIWLAQYPPMVDLPQYAAQINSLSQVLAGNPAFTDVFEINWFTPYVMGYLLTYALALLLPLGLALKVIISLSVMAVPVVSGMLFREVGADERWKWLAIPAGYSLALYFGFISYIVAVPFGLYFLVLTARFNRRASLGMGCLIAAYAMFLLLCHLLVLAYTSLLALTYLAAANRRNIKVLLWRWLPYTAPLPLIFTWLILTHQSESLASETHVFFGFDMDRLWLILEHLSGMDATHRPLVLMLSALIIAFPFFAGARWSRRPERWWPLLVGTAVFLVFPSQAFGTAVLYERFGVFLPPLWLMAWSAPRARQPRWHWLAMAAICLWTGLNAYRFSMYDRDVADFKHVMAAMAPDKKALSIVAVSGSPYFSYPVYLHLPLWYQAERNGIVDFSFANVFQVMVRYKAERAPKIEIGFEHDPVQFRWDRHDGDAYDYFVVHANEDIGKVVFKNRRKSVRLVAQSGWWWLYEPVEARSGGR